MDARMSVAITWASTALEEIGECIGTEEYSRALLESPDEVGIFFEEELMCEVYTRIEQDFGIFLEPSTQACFGTVTAFRNEDCKWTLGRDVYDFGEEIKRAMEILSNLDNETATVEDFVSQMVNAIKELLMVVGG